jgi:hypothetical protein
LSRQRDSGIRARLALDHGLRRQLHTFAGQGILIISVRDAVFGVNFVKMLKEDTPHLEDRLADHMHRGVMRVDHELTFDVVH